MNKSIIYLFFISVMCGCKDSEIKQSISLSSLKNEWTSLTKTKEGLVIYESCDGGNAIYTIFERKDSVFLIQNGTQESTLYYLKEAYKSKLDTIFIDACYYSTDDEFKFKLIIIDSTKGLYKLINCGISEETLVISSKKENFKEITQPCTECFERETCDEFRLNDSIKVNAKPILKIKYIVEGFIASGDPIDETKNVKTIQESISSLGVIGNEELAVIINAWIYYVPAGVEIKDNLLSILKKDKENTIKGLTKIQKSLNYSDDNSKLMATSIDNIINELK
jgi:hypothetical protein